MDAFADLQVQALRTEAARILEETNATARDLARQCAACNDRLVISARDQLAQINRILPELLSWKLLAFHAETAASIQDSIARMSSQWVDVQDSLKSIRAAAELHTLGAGLAVKPFSSALTEAMRLDLGSPSRIFLTTSRSSRATITWNEVFKAIFGRKEDIQESLIRLAPVRICAMHCRVITPDDHLILLAEARRIFRALKTRKTP